jgi:hypothetical protein
MARFAQHLRSALPCAFAWLVAVVASFGIGGSAAAVSDAVVSTDGAAAFAIAAETWVDPGWGEARDPERADAVSDPLQLAYGYDGLRTSSLATDAVRSVTAAELGKQLVSGAPDRSEHSYDHHRNRARFRAPGRVSIGPTSDRGDLQVRHIAHIPGCGWPSPRRHGGES